MLTYFASGELVSSPFRCRSRAKETLFSMVARNVERFASRNFTNKMNVDAAAAYGNMRSGLSTAPRIHQIRNKANAPIYLQERGWVAVGV